MIDVAQDGDGVRDAVALLLEESFFHHSAARTLAGLEEADRARVLGNGPQRTLSPGYYRWAAYLLSLEETRDCDVQLGELQPIEIAGLVQVRRARHDFNVAHPCCSCGHRLESRWVPSCDGCGAEFRRAS